MDTERTDTYWIERNKFMESTIAPYDPHIPCERQGGHVFPKPTEVKGLDNTVVTCLNCGKVRA